MEAFKATIMGVSSTFITFCDDSTSIAAHTNSTAFSHDFLDEFSGRNYQEYFDHCFASFIPSSRGRSDSILSFEAKIYPFWIFVSISHIIRSQTGSSNGNEARFGEKLRTPPTPNHHPRTSTSIASKSLDKHRALPF
jgi:hypothetical protein